MIRRALPVLLAIAFVSVMAYWRITWRMEHFHVSAWEAFWW